MDLFPLPLFPEGGLASSVITTVWVGVLVLCFFNLRLGWTFSGLVVPGYLVPLIMVRPFSALAVVVEGCVAYAVVWFVSEKLGRLGPWSNLLGRDRFFALILCSVAVRVLFDGWLLPALGAALVDSYQIAFDFRNDLQSFGLIIVALVANQFWKTGLRRGLPPFLVTLSITFLIVRFVLMELTNFSLTKLSYMYEEVASSLLASPKAYIVIITTAFVASRLNLKYSWDFNGILLPSLLALQWFQPAKIVTSVVEAWVILLMAQLVLATPWFRRKTIEGAAKLGLFFNLAFLYKLALGYLILALRPELKVSDFFGMGYLLSTLLAIKMHDKGLALKLASETVQASLVGVTLASLIGFGLTRLPGAGVTEPGTQGEAAALGEIRTHRAELVEVLRSEKLRLYRSRLPGWEKRASQLELEQFEQALRTLDAYLGTGDAVLLERARDELWSLGCQLSLVQERYLLISEAAAPRGLGLYVFDTRRVGGLVVEVPLPFSERLSAESAALLYHALQASSLAIGGPGAQGDASRRSFFHVFHRVLGRRNVLQIRALAEPSSLTLPTAETEGNRWGPRREAQLWVKGELPPDLDLAQLKGLLGPMRIEWGVPPYENIQRTSSRSAFAELLLSHEAKRGLLASSYAQGQDPTAVGTLRRETGSLRQWLLDRKSELAQRASDLYVPPTLWQLLFLDDEVMTPLNAIARRTRARGELSVEDESELTVVRSAASALGQDVLLFHDLPSGTEFLLLAEAPSTDCRRYWGTFVMRLSEAQRFVVQVPRPLMDLGSFEFGIELFDRLHAQALLIAGSHAMANRDGSTELTRSEAPASVFNLLHQVTMREARARPLMAVQCRGSAADGAAALAADALLTTARGILSRDLLSTLERGLVETLEADRLSVELATGSAATRGYGLAGLAQAAYLDQGEAKELAVLWLSPRVRDRFRLSVDEPQEQERFAGAGIPSVESDLFAHLSATAGGDEPTELMPALRSAIVAYLDRRDVVALHALRSERPDLNLLRLVDPVSGEGYLVLRSHDRSPVVVNLTSDSESELTGELSAKTVARFVRTHTRWLRLAARP